MTSRILTSTEVVAKARSEAIEKSGIPQHIRDKYRVVVDPSGVVIFSKERYK